MTKKKPKGESEKDQSDRFKEAAQKLIDAGELNPTEADAVLESMVRGAKRSSNPQSQR